MKVTLFRSELDATYGLRPGFALSLRLPYDVKETRVHYTTLSGAPFVPPYGDIHHRTETLRGISDAELLLLWAPSTRGRSHWQFGIGTSVPLGDTVADPIALGRAGKEHQHLQFGIGVFAPEVEVAWRRPIRTFLASAVVQATIPVSTNRHGFRAPVNVQWSAGSSFPVARTRVGLDLTGQYQTVGRWNGEADEGTGFSNGGLRLQLSIPAARRVTIAPSVYRELFSHGMHDETFAQGTTLGLSINRSF